MTPDLSQISDRELAALAKAGRQDAYREFLARYKAPTFRLIYRNIGDADEAMDLTQEAFVSGFAALDRYDADRPFKVWIARIALNKCRDWARRRKVRSFFSRARGSRSCWPSVPRNRRCGGFCCEGEGRSGRARMEM